jgi:hypothetical protein
LFFYVLFVTLGDGQFPNIEHFLNYRVAYVSMYVNCALKHILPCKRSATQLGRTFPLSSGTAVPHNSLPLDSVTNEINPASSQWCLSSNLGKHIFTH